MNKPNILFKKTVSVSSGLGASKTSKFDPRLYCTHSGKRWAFDCGTVNGHALRVNKKLWHKGFPANIEYV